jgi:hypothetical protein
MIYVSVRDLVSNKIVRQYELSDNLSELAINQFNIITQAKGVIVLWQSEKELLAVITVKNTPFLVQARTKKGVLKVGESSPKSGDNPPF